MGLVHRFKTILKFVFKCFKFKNVNSEIKERKYNNNNINLERNKDCETWARTSELWIKRLSSSPHDYPYCSLKQEMYTS